MPRRRTSRHRPAVAALAGLILAASGCAGAGDDTGAGAGTEAGSVVTTPSPALVARGGTLASCLAAAGLGGQPAQLTPIDLRTAVVGVAIAGLPSADGTRTDAGGIVWLFEGPDQARDAIPQLTAPSAGEREQYIDGAAIVILYEGAAPEEMAVLQRCVGGVSEAGPEPGAGEPGDAGQAPGKAEAPAGATATVPAGSPPSSA